MDKKPVTNDDLMDVIEMKSKLEEKINLVLNGNEVPLAMAALMGALVNIILRQCQDRQEAISYRNLLFELYERGLSNFQDVNEMH